MVLLNPSAYFGTPSVTIGLWHRCRNAAKDNMFVFSANAKVMILSHLKSEVEVCHKLLVLLQGRIL